MPLYAASSCLAGKSSLRLFSVLFEKRNTGAKPFEITRRVYKPRKLREPKIEDLQTFSCYGNKYKHVRKVLGVALLN